MIQLTDNVYATALPEGAADVGFVFDCFACKVPDLKPNTYKWLVDASSFMREKGGQWEFICTSSVATIEDAKNIVDRFTAIGNVYLNYMNQYEGGDFCFNALDSLRSLLKSKGLDGNYALLRKL